MLNTDMSYMGNINVIAQKILSSGVVTLLILSSAFGRLVQSAPTSLGGKKVSRPPSVCLLMPTDPLLSCREAPPPSPEGLMLLFLNMSD